MSERRSIGARSLPPERRAQSSLNGGAVSARRKNEILTPRELWELALPGVLKRFRQDMAERYGDEGDE